MSVCRQDQRAEHAGLDIGSVGADLTSEGKAHGEEDFLESFPGKRRQARHGLDAQSQLMPLESYEVGRLPVIAVTFIAAILENLFKGAGIGGGEEERADGLIERVACRVRSGAAAHDV